MSTLVNIGLSFAMSPMGSCVRSTLKIPLLVGTIFFCAPALAQKRTDASLLKRAEAVYTTSLYPDAAELEKTKRGSRSKFEQVAAALGIVQLQLNSGQWETAVKTFEQIPLANKKPPGELAEVYALLGARAYAKVSRDLDAITLLRPFSELKGVFHSKAIVSSYMQSMIAAGFAAEALEYFSENEDFFVRNFDDFEMEELRLSLGLLLIERGDSLTATDYLVSVAENFPITDLSRTAHKTLDLHFCNEPGTFFLPSELEEQRKRARQILLHLGPLPDVRQYVFALANINESSFQNLKRADVVYDFKGRLDELDFLISAREYNLAEDLARKMKKYKPAKVSAEEKERFLFLYARAMNGVHKPREAAASYRQLWTQLPRARLANQAKSRYALSLLYAKDYKNASKVFRSLPSSASRKSVADWNAFWSDYLSGNTVLAKKAANEIAKSRAAEGESKVGARYWQARLTERQRNLKSARAQLVSIATNSNHSFYAVLARWRIGLIDEKLERKSRARAKHEMEGLGEGDSGVQVWSELELRISQDANPRLKYIQSLLDFGLLEFASAELEFFSSSVRDRKEALDIARLSVRAQNFKLTSLVPRRTLWDLRAIPSNEAELSRELVQNREAWQMSFPLAYGQVVQELAKANGIDPYLLLSVMRAESNFDVSAFSPVGALGLLQIMPQTGTRIASQLGIRDFKPRSLLEPHVNIAFASWYLSRLSEHYSGNIPLTVAAYNAGPEAIDRWLGQYPRLEIDEFIENIPFKETRTYVSRVLQNLDMYNRIYGDSGRGLALKMDAHPPDKLSDQELF